MSRTLPAPRLAIALLIALCALTSPAFAEEPSPAAGVGGTSVASVSDVPCPCNADLPQAYTVLSAEPSACPCNAGVLGGLSPAVAASSGGKPTQAYTVLGAGPSACPCNAGVLGGPAPVVAVSSGGGPTATRIESLAPSTQPNQTSAFRSSETFDWADAGVGASFTVIIGLLVAGGALVFSRRQARGQLAAGSGD
jgi:hypothetical protein